MISAGPLLRNPAGFEGRVPRQIQNVATQQYSEFSHLQMVTIRFGICPSLQGPI